VAACHLDHALHVAIPEACVYSVPAHREVGRR
jgi:hypothetical protein